MGKANQTTTAAAAANDAVQNSAVQDTASKEDTGTPKQPEAILENIPEAPKWEEPAAPFATLRSWAPEVVIFTDIMTNKKVHVRPNAVAAVAFFDENVTAIHVGGPPILVEGTLDDVTEALDF